MSEVGSARIQTTASRRALTRQRRRDMRNPLNTFSRVVTSTVIAVSLLALSSATAQAGPRGLFKMNITLMQPKAVKTGDNQFEVTVKGTDGKPLSDADVSMMFLIPAMPA